MGGFLTRFVWGRNLVLLSGGVVRMWDCRGEASAFLVIDFVVKDRVSFPIAESILLDV